VPKNLSWLVGLVTRVLRIKQSRRDGDDIAESRSALHVSIIVLAPTSREPSIPRELMRSPVVAAILTIVAASLLGPGLVGLAATPGATPTAAPNPTPTAAPTPTPTAAPTPTPTAASTPTQECGGMKERRPYASNSVRQCHSVGVSRLECDRRRARLPFGR
jgi:hypothetical protein